MELDEETIALLSFVSKYIFLPIFILYLFGIEVLIIGGMYRQALTLTFLVFTLNAMIWNREVFR